MRREWSVVVLVALAAACVGEDSTGGAPDQPDASIIRITDSGANAGPLCPPGALVCEDFDHAPPFALDVTSLAPATSGEVESSLASSLPSAAKLVSGLVAAKPMGAGLVKMLTVALPAKVRVSTRMQRAKDCAPQGPSTLDVARLVFSRGADNLVCAASLGASGAVVAVRASDTFLTGSPPGQVPLSSDAWVALTLEATVTATDLACSLSVDGANATVGPATRDAGSPLSGELVVNLGPNVDSSASAYVGPCTIFFDDVVVENVK